jgi:hypothetical protein
MLARRLFGATILAMLFFISRAQAGDNLIAHLLPSGAKIMETNDIGKIAGKSRVLVLWMTDATKHERENYCGDFVYGDSWEGLTRVSLIDPVARSVVNTVEIGRTQLPYHVGRSYYYVPRLGKDQEGTPRLLHLKDFTGEGRAAQFPLFIYDACGIASASLYGYRPAKDRVVRYEIEVIERGKKNTTSSASVIFSSRAVRPGYWSFEWDPGHGSDVTYREIVRFDPKRQIFMNTHIAIKQ